MSVTWDATTFANFYGGKIRWADPNDPGNSNGERIGQSWGYGIDMARYAERGAFVYAFWYRRAAWLLNRLILAGFAPQHRLLVVAAGYGYLPYAFRHASLHPDFTEDFPNCWGIELPSSHIQTNYVAERLEDNLVFVDWTKYSTGQSVKNALNNATGGSTFHVIMNWYTESFQIRDPATGVENTTETADFNDWLDLCEAALIGTNTSRVINLIDNALNPGETYQDYPTQVAAGCAVRTLAEWASFRPAHTWLDTRTGEFILGAGF